VTVSSWSALRWPTASNRNGSPTTNGRHQRRALQRTRTLRRHRRWNARAGADGTGSTPACVARHGDQAVRAHQRGDDRRVDDVENGAVLTDLADAANVSCAGQPRYAAVIGRRRQPRLPRRGDGAGRRAWRAGTGPPTMDAAAKLTSLQVQGSSGSAPVTLLMPRMPPSNWVGEVDAAAWPRTMAAVRAEADPRSRIVLIGDVTLPGLLDLTARSLPASRRCRTSAVS